MKQKKNVRPKQTKKKEHKQVIKNIRNVTRHRNGQSIKSRQTRWEWQLLISIMHIHDVVTRYNNCPFLFNTFVPLEHIHESNSHQYNMVTRQKNRDVDMPCTQEWAIIVACHHIMNMHVACMSLLEVTL